MTPSRFQIRAAAKAIKNQGVIAYPTESVFGLGCLPLSESAVSKLLHLKRRPAEKGLILIASKLAQLENFTILSDADREKINAQNTATTWLVNKSELTPEWISGKHKKVAIRVSKHPIVSALCDEVGGTIVSTSANTSTAKAAANILQVRQYFPVELDYYLAGETGDIISATPIIDIETMDTIRS